ncbi:MAG: hypothetical protein D6807_00830 [Alphaproteobacteria bacterium]|nr:MAG: hypothetical protein D6807_00830 [Alphaproteobacteria bacterium]
MRRIAFATLSLLIAVLAVPAFGHSFYAALTRINYNARAGTIEVIHRLVAHDMEAVLSAAAGERLTFDGATRARAEADAGAYLAAHFTLVAGDRPLPLEFVGTELDGDDLFAYFEAPIAAPPKRLKIRDRIFTAELPQQRNLVVATIGGATASAQFTRDTDEGTLELAP